MTVAVIGAGVFGSWCAWFLAQAGHRVTLIDAYGPANGRASSADHSRVIRAGYGADEIYSRWALASLSDWTWLARETQQDLVVRTGALFMASSGNVYVRDTYATLMRLGVDAELLQPPTLASRFPYMTVEGVGIALYEPPAGVLRARAAVQALVRLLRTRELAEYRVARLEAPDEAAAQPIFRTSSGQAVQADFYVLACGPWLPRLLPESVGGRIRTTRQEVLYFGVPPGDDRFSVSRMPVWIDFEAGAYGIPDLDAQGFKIGIDRHGPPLDPETDDRIVDGGLVGETRRWIGRRFPDLGHAPLLDARVCQYENTVTGDFLIDRHPLWRNVWIVGGGSGHGFKHGPAVGRHVAALVAGDEHVFPRFALATKTTEARRAIY